MLKLKILDLKFFTDKCMKYKSWKTNIINKIEINHEKFSNNYKRKAYIFNYLENDGRNQAKIIIFVYLKVYQLYLF